MPLLLLSLDRFPLQFQSCLKDILLFPFLNTQLLYPWLLLLHYALLRNTYIPFEIPILLDLKEPILLLFDHSLLPNRLADNCPLEPFPVHKRLRVIDLNPDLIAFVQNNAQGYFHVEHVESIQWEIIFLVRESSIVEFLSMSCGFGHSCLGSWRILLFALPLALAWIITIPTH